MSTSRPFPSKTQPWRALIPSEQDREGFYDICGTTDRPWVRQMLADHYHSILNGPRQERYPEYKVNRGPDPFKGIYKAESKDCIRISLEIVPATRCIVLRSS